ncbi:MAG TPA: type 2 isopentenyl-diphosphate Delta-isomerase [Candidatus Baltobacteraceae bacterium]|nr:type 2 isopentenyl-diphosphate Delta-isomerase [Candidatus Baltobacteraceae bacterium]
MSKDEKVRLIMKRKEDHINICVDEHVQAKKATTLFENVHLLNNSLPEIDFDEIDTSTTFLGHKFSAPIMVGAMTGGAKLAEKINRNIAEACQDLGLGMAVGSQRAGLYDKRLERTYSIARKVAPDIFLGTNVGGAQLSKGFSIADGKKLVKMLDADAFYIHLNPEQEVTQPEGEPNYRNVLSKIADFVDKIDKPIVAKEVGSGISGEVAKRLEGAGVSAIEVAGTGGTSYVAVEYYRAKEMKMRSKTMLGELFWDWGIPTAASLLMVKKAVKIPVVSSGGIRSGLEIAKSVGMGATMCAQAQPMLKPAMESPKAVRQHIEDLVHELKTAMFLTGCKNIRDLSRLKYVITGELREWIED